MAMKSVAIAALLALGACGGSGDNPPEVSKATTTTTEAPTTVVSTSTTTAPPRRPEPTFDPASLDACSLLGLDDFRAVGAALTNAEPDNFQTTEFDLCFFTISDEHDSIDTVELTVWRDPYESLIGQPGDEPISGLGDSAALMRTYIPTTSRASVYWCSPS